MLQPTLLVLQKEGRAMKADMTAKARSSIFNAIWLCQNCAKKIDSDPIRFTVELLKEWKEEAEREASERAGKAVGRVPRTDLDDIPSLQKKARPAAKALVDHGKTRWHYPGVVVPVRLEIIEKLQPLQDPHRIVGYDEILSMVGLGANLFLEGEAGAGKTTALIELCTSLLDDDKKPLPIFLDAATWAASGRSLLDHIAGFSSFLALGIGAAQLARLREAGQLLIVMNGWNEIGASRQIDARQLLQAYLVGTTAPRVVVATRTANDSLGIPSPKRIAVLGFGWEQQKSLIRQALEKHHADELIQRLRADQRLRSVTRNPLVLSGVVSLHKSGQAIPDNPFDLIAAIVVAYEEDDERAAALKQHPLRDCQRSYAKAMAVAMNTSATTLLSEEEAHRTVHVVGNRLVEDKLLRQAPESSDVVSELCNRYLLHETGAATIRFAHQRFQEYFAAEAILERLDSGIGTEHERRAFQKDVLNWPFWEDAVDLVATKLVVDKTRIAQKRLLVELTILVDLAYAARLAGEVRLAPSDGVVWATLQKALEVLYSHPATEAKHYALESMVATRSPVFAEFIWPLLEDDDGQVRLQAYRLADRLTIEQLGADAANRMATWSDERRAEAISALSDRPENFAFIAHLARSEVGTPVRVAAINALDFHGATDAALQAWRMAPINVKESTVGVAFELWSPDQTELTQELVQLARTSTDSKLSRSIGLRLLGYAAEIGQDAAREALRAPSDRQDTATLAQFVMSFDPQFIRDLAVERLWQSRRNPDWVKEAIATLPRNEREVLFESALEQMSKTEHESFDISLLASGASESQIEALLDEGQRYVIAWITMHQMDEATRMRYSAVDRGLHHVPGDLLIKSVLGRADRSSYYEAAWHVEILDSRVPDPSDANEEGAPWRPTIDELDLLTRALQAKRDPREVPHCSLEAHLAFLVSKIDPKRYLPFLLEATKRYLHAWSTFEEVLQQWLASRDRAGG